MPTLYEIGDSLTALDALLDECDGDITDAEAEAAIDDWLAETNAALETKVDGYCALIREIEARAEARKLEAKRLMALAGMSANKAERLRRRLKAFFEAHGIGKLETDRFHLTIAKNGGQAPLIIPTPWATEPASAPEAFHKVTVELNTQAIREALAEAGADLCPECGDRATPLDHDPADATVMIVQCRSCAWAGEPHETARYGERGHHLRLR